MKWWNTILGLAEVVAKLANFSLFISKIPFCISAITPGPKQSSPGTHWLKTHINNLNFVEISWKTCSESLIIPKVTNGELYDQFDFKPSGNTRTVAAFFYIKPC